MRRLTSPRRRDISTRRTLEPDWPKVDYDRKLKDEENRDEDDEDSDIYPDSDSTEINLRRKSSKLFVVCLFL